MEEFLAVDGAHKAIFGPASSLKERPLDSSREGTLVSAFAVTHCEPTVSIVCGSFFFVCLECKEAKYWLVPSTSACIT